MDAGLACAVIGSVAGAVAVPAGVVIGIMQLRQARRDARSAAATDPPGQLPGAGSQAELPGVQGAQLGSHNLQVNQFLPQPQAQPDSGPVAVGVIPQEPLGYQPRADLMAALDAPDTAGRVTVVRAVTGMRGVGKTQLAAAYARARLARRWRLVAWISAENSGGVLASLAEAAAQLGLASADDAEAAGRLCGTGSRPADRTACWYSTTRLTRS
jgi:hypothetical protein